MIGKSNLWSWSCKCSRHRAITIKKKKKTQHQAPKIAQRRAIMTMLSKCINCPAKGDSLPSSSPTDSGALQSLHLHKETPQLIGAWKGGNKMRLCILHTEWNMKCNRKRQMWAFWLFAKREQTGRMITMQCSSYMCNHNKYDVYWKSKWRWLKDWGEIIVTIKYYTLCLAQP